MHDVTLVLSEGDKTQVQKGVKQLTRGHVVGRSRCCGWKSIQNPDEPTIPDALVRCGSMTQVSLMLSESESASQLIVSRKEAIQIITDVQA